MRDSGECKVEASVYGAAIVMPQLARTVGWDKTMTSFAFQSWIFLLFNIFLQAYLLKMIAKEEVVMDGFAGQMYLCDFGANMEQCPGPGCRGPYGTEITGPRLYNWDAIANRNFVKDSLKALFPDRSKEIDAKIDVGEYGVESYWCRLSCCFIFMISCMGELVVTYKQLQLLYKIPTADEPWIETKQSDGEEAQLVGSIEEVRIAIAGMPLAWKFINFVLVVLPKFFLWRMTAVTGVAVLMDTSGIDDIITNSVGLTFILSLDELICEALMPEEIENFVLATESFPLFDPTTSCVGDMSLLTEAQILQEYQKSQHGIWAWGFWDLVTLLPLKLLMALLGTVGFVYEYYYKHCTTNGDDANRLISKTIYVPQSMHFGWLNAFLPHFFPYQVSQTTAWEMPDHD
jgi:hypothetical protein